MSPTNEYENINEENSEMHNIGALFDAIMTLSLRQRHVSTWQCLTETEKGSTKRQ